MCPQAWHRANTRTPRLEYSSTTYMRDRPVQPTACAALTGYQMTTHDLSRTTIPHPKVRMHSPAITPVVLGGSNTSLVLWQLSQEIRGI